MSNQSLTTSPASFRNLWKNFFDSDFFTDRYFDKLWDTAAPAVNIAETGDAYKMDIIVPGFKKEDIRLDVENGMLTIQAEAKHETSDEQKEYKRKEYNFSSFSHAFRLPENVKDDSLTAEYKDGVLKVVLPKKEIQANNSKNITVQ